MTNVFSIRHAALTVLTAVSGLFASASVTVVDRPAIGTESRYTAFRAPLQQAHLIKLPVGAVKPGGWLGKYLTLQRDGLNGRLGTVSAWLDKTDNQWLSDKGNHGWEEVPYWLRGYSSLAYILADEAMINEAQTWFEAVLANQKPDGFLGPRNFDGDRPELWAQMIMLRALQTYYEFSGDRRVIDAMTRFFRWEMTVPDNLLLEGLWEHPRGGDNLASLLWLYNITGDRSLLPLAEKLHRNTADWTMHNDLPNFHGVNFAQGFREPATYYMVTGDSTQLLATYNNLSLMHERFGQVPGGMYGADENARAGHYDPRQGAETCAIVEQMMSDEYLLALTGDPSWADHCEQVAFNCFTASMMPDMRSLRYITSPNMAISDEKLHGPSIDNNLRGMLSMSPFSSRCCQHNHGMGWPYYAENLVMATTDGGLATVLYADCTATAEVAGGKRVTLTESTRYPFDETVTLTVATDSPAEFPLYLRVPDWAAGAIVKVNGKQQPLGKSDPAGRYIRIDRRWADGDRVTLQLPMSLTADFWRQNKESVSLNYGPLTLSLLIATEAEPHDSRDRAFVQDDSHWQQGVDASLWPCYVLRPQSKWNYALVVGSDNMPRNFCVRRRGWPADDMPFTAQGTPLTFTAEGAEIPSWGYDATGMTDILPTPFAPRSAVNTRISLIPMGAALLRISAFPRKISDNK